MEGEEMMRLELTGGSGYWSMIDLPRIIDFRGMPQRFHR